MWYMCFKTIEKSFLPTAEVLQPDCCDSVKFDKQIKMLNMWNWLGTMYFDGDLTRETFLTL